MRKSLIAGLCFYFCFVIISTNFFSCSSTKKIKYFQDIPDSGQVKQIPKADYTPLLIQNGDILTVSIYTIDPLTSSTINQGNATPGVSSSMPGAASGAAGLLASLSGASQQQAPESGYLVDKQGLIEIPIIGKLEAAGHTTDELKEAVEKIAVKYYKDPTVTVHFANFKVNVTGEVLKPGQYVMPEEKETIMDAIAMAGDLTIFGKRENVLLIRQNVDGTRTAYRVNLKKSDALNSPVYYLRQNDFIYVEPRKAKSDANDAAQVRYYGIAAAVASILIIIATRAK